MGLRHRLLTRLRRSRWVTVPASVRFPCSVVDFWGNLSIDLVPEARGCLCEPVVDLFDCVRGRYDLRLRPNSSVLMITESKAAREPHEDYVYWLWTLRDGRLLNSRLRVGSALDAVFVEDS